tara:strand:- start:28157 stop:32308 length:4152 start_codon:yes stop_codon:yes gene_type:complete
MPPWKSVLAQTKLYFSALVVLLILGAATAATAQPVFSQSLQPDTVGPGTTTRLSFVIDNSLGAATDGLSVSETLPAGMSIASPSAVATTCIDGVVSGVEGGSTISLTGARLGAGQQCTVSVQVLSPTAGTFISTSGDLTSSAGNSGTSSAQLEVVTTMPAFSASISPSTIAWGSATTITYTLDNSASSQDQVTVSFTDTFEGAVIASPSNLQTTCVASLVPLELVAEEGSNQLALRMNGISFSPALVAGDSCTVTVNILPDNVGRFEHTTADLLVQFSTVGFATAAVQVTRDSELHLTSEFLLSQPTAADPAVSEFISGPTLPGGSVFMRFTVWNFHRTSSATGVAFTTDLGATIPGLVATGLPLADPCGAGSQLSGTSVITLTGASIPFEESCTFVAEVSVPVNSPLGIVTNTSSPITGTLGGVAVTGSAASANLLVETAPIITQSFSPNPAIAGGTVVVEYTIENPSLSETATNIGYSDELSASFPGLVFDALPADGFCGTGSTISVQGFDGNATIVVTGAELAPTASCVFDVEIIIAAATENGIYEHRTGTLTAVLSGRTVTAKKSVQLLEIVAGPKLRKSFSESIVEPGDTVQLEYQLTFSDEAASDATDVSFSDDFDALMPGLVATNLPIVDVCGQGAQITGTANLSLTGGSLQPGDTCSFVVNLQLPIDAAAQQYISTSSEVSSTVNGLAPLGQAATDTLTVASLLFDMEFLESPVTPGSEVTLQYSIENISASETTDASFVHAFGSTLPGLTTTTVTTADVCGAGSQLTISGTTALLSGGTLAAGTSCVFSIALQVPNTTSADSYATSTNTLNATVGGAATTHPAANAVLLIADPLLLSMSFVEERGIAGGTVTLDFTIANADATETVTDLAFSDDLGAALSGLVSESPSQNAVCGAASTLTGTDTLVFTGGSLAPASFCTFSVTLRVPSNVAFGDRINNLTEALTATFAGQAIVSNQAAASLELDVVALRAAFAGTMLPGGTGLLSFTLENSQNSSISGLRFSNDLEAALSGLQATTLPADGFCGASAEAAGTDALLFENMSLAALASCTFEVEVLVPTDAAPGDYVNITSSVAVAGEDYGAPARAPFQVSALPPVLGIAFVPAVVGVSEASQLVLTIDNSANSVAVIGLSLLGSLPDALQIEPGDASTDCLGGALTANVGDSEITLENATVEAGSLCTIELPVASDTVGTYLSLVELTSEVGSSPAAMATLLVGVTPSLQVSFAPQEIGLDDTTLLVIEIGNASDVPVGSLAFTVSLPDGLFIATPNAAQNSCGGEFLAQAGAQGFTLAGGGVEANASCTIEVQVASNAAGTYPFALTLRSAAGESEADTELIVEGSPGGGCCSTASNKQRFPIEVLLFLAVWCFLGMRRRKAQ